MPPRVRKPVPPGRLFTRPSNAGKHPGYVNKSSDEGATPELKTLLRPRKLKVTKTAKSAEALAGNIKCLTAYEKKYLADDAETVTPHPLFTPAPVHLDIYKKSLPSSVEHNYMSDDPIGGKKTAQGDWDRREMELDIVEGTLMDSDSDCDEALDCLIPPNAMLKKSVLLKVVTAKVDGGGPMASKAKGKGKVQPSSEDSATALPLMKKSGKKAKKIMIIDIGSADKEPKKSMELKMSAAVKVVKVPR